MEVTVPDGTRVCASSLAERDARAAAQIRDAFARAHAGQGWNG